VSGYGIVCPACGVQGATIYPQYVAAQNARAHDQQQHDGTPTAFVTVGG
jgi:hypothetical protein